MKGAARGRKRASGKIGGSSLGYLI